MKNRLSFWIVLLFPIFVMTSAFSQQRSLEGLGFKLGDDVKSVKSALNTEIEPEPVPIPSSYSPTLAKIYAGKSVINLRTKGIRVTFNADGKLETIHLSEPYSGAVKGIKMGDKLDKVTSIFGRPVMKPWTGFYGMLGYKFALDDYSYISFHLDDDGVHHMVITK